MIKIHHREAPIIKCSVKKLSKNSKLHRITCASDVCSSSFSLQTSIVAVILIQEIEWTGFGQSTAALPSWGCERLWGIVATGVCEHILKGLGPLDSVVQALQSPQFLQEVQDRAVSVCGVFGI